VRSGEKSFSRYENRKKMGSVEGSRRNERFITPVVARVGRIKYPRSQRQVIASSLLTAEEENVRNAYPQASLSLAPPLATCMRCSTFSVLIAST
jgi:hypothetical protein